jgi:uncharacterized membrane protein
MRGTKLTTTNEQSEISDAGARNLLFADLGLVVFFGLLSWVAIAIVPSASVALYLVAWAAYVAAKVFGAMVCDYRKFHQFIAEQDRRSVNGAFGLSGFSAFKGALVAMIAVGFVLISPWILIGESVLVVLMRLWAKGYD